MLELEISPCSAGEHGNSDDACVACEIGKYNHGDSRDCYAIENNMGIVYKDRFGVKCATGWVGSPFYEDGKYEGGCEDGDVAVDIINLIISWYYKFIFYYIFCNFSTSNSKIFIIKLCNNYFL